MGNLTRTVRDTSGVVLDKPVFDDRTLVATGAETWPAGSVLGKVTASGNLARFDPDGTDGSEVPYAVLTYEVEFAEAGTLKERPLIGGHVRLGKLLDVDGAAVDADAVDALRDVGIIALATNQLLIEDN